MPPPSSVEESGRDPVQLCLPGDLPDSPGGWEAPTLHQSALLSEVQQLLAALARELSLCGAEEAAC